MSLTHLIQCDGYKEFFKEIIPKKTDFKTISGHTAFSKEYEAKAPYNLINQYNAGLVGTAFDYIARWKIARVTNFDKENSYTSLIAEEGIPICQYNAIEKGIDVKECYEKGLSCCKKFIYGKNNFGEVVKVAIFFAKLEQVRRSLVPPFRVEIDDLFCVEEEVVNDLIKLSEVFEKYFIEEGLVNEESVVVYNPTFGGASYICGGADADIFIDGTLYDFKCVKRCGYVWQEIAQLLGYYLLDCYAKRNNDENNLLKECEIKRIALYRARYGETEYYDLKSCNSYELTDRFELLMGKNAYIEYFEGESKKEEDETKLKRLLNEEKKNKEIEFKRKYTLAEKKIMVLLQCFRRKILKDDYYNYYEIAMKINECNNDETRYSLMSNYLYLTYRANINEKFDGKKLLALLNEKNISTEQLGESLSFRKKASTVEAWIKGKNNPPIGAIIDMVEILDCELKDLIKFKNK